MSAWTISSKNVVTIADKSPTGNDPLTGAPFAPRLSIKKTTASDCNTCLQVDAAMPGTDAAAYVMQYSSLSTWCAAHALEKV